MIWLLKPDHPKTTEFAPAMAESMGILPGLPAVAGKPVHVAFDGGRLTSDAGVLLLAAVEQRLRIAERLAACLEDPRDPDQMRHELLKMIRWERQALSSRSATRPRPPRQAANLTVPPTLLGYALILQPGFIAGSSFPVALARPLLMPAAPVR